MHTLHMRMPPQLAGCGSRPPCRFLARPVSTNGDLHQLVALCNATSSHAASHKRRLRPPAATDDAHEDLTDAEGLTDIDEMDANVSVEQQDATVDTDAATTDAPAAPTQPVPAPQASAAKSQQRRMVAPSISPDFVAKAKVAGLAAVGVAAAVGVGLMLRKVASAQMPKMQKVMEQRQLQKESMQRLNSFMEQVCVGSDHAHVLLHILACTDPQQCIGGFVG